MTTVQTFISIARRKEIIEIQRNKCLKTSKNNKTEQRTKLNQRRKKRLKKNNLDMKEPEY
jgi:hypothetical protein